MNPATLNAQAQQSATQGQQMQANDQNTAAQNQTAYNGYQNQATDQANKINQQSAYMQGAGSGQNVYNSNLSGLEAKSGYNPQSMATANQNLFKAQGILGGANQQFSTPGATSAFGGLSGAALGSYEGSILQPLQQGMSNANSQVGTLNNELNTFMTGANQATTNQVQSEQATLGGLNDAETAYQTQAAQAMSNLQFFNDQAQKQGGLNASNQQAYASAVNGLAQAKNALAQIQLFKSQAALAQAQVGGAKAQSQAYENQLNATPSPATGNSGNSGNLTASNIMQPTVNGASLQGGGLQSLQGGNGLQVQVSNAGSYLQ